MGKQNVFEIILGNEYYTLDDLRYNKQVGKMFSKEELTNFLIEKDQFVEEDCEFIKKLPLKTFNSKYSHHPLQGKAHPLRVRFFAFKR